MKVTLIENSEQQYMFECPGCEISHAFDKRWSFNGNLDRPTFQPSLLVHWTQYEPSKQEGKKYDEKECVCHSFVTDGKIQFLNDCTHKLAGQTVEMEERQ